MEMLKQKLSKWINEKKLLSLEKWKLLQIKIQIKMNKYGTVKAYNVCISFMHHFTACLTYQLCEFFGNLSGINTKLYER